jgi:alpha-tubulin suppressor-like RCC1 family protein
MGDNLTTVDLGTGGKAKAIAAGYQHTCAILDNESVKCWGLNDEGQLGLNADDSRGDEPDEMGDNLPAIDLRSTGRTAASITTGAKHTCVMDDNASIKCWGYGYYGQLGKGEQKSLNRPPQNVLELGSGRNAKAIVAGNFHNCVMLDNSSIKCWGLNDSGQLGQGDTNNRGDGFGDNPNNLPSIDLGSGKTARAISAGDRHTCAILDNASIKCWGSNISGELGIGNTENRGDNSSKMGDNLPVISL